MMPFGWHLEMCLQEKQVDLVLDNHQELTESSRPSSTIGTKMWRWSQGLCP